MSDKPIPPSVAEHALQTCLAENGDQIGMAATIAQQAELIRLQDLIAQAKAAPEPVQGEAVELQHMAVAEDGELRWMSGRKVANCELYAMPDFGRAPKLYTAPPSPDAELVDLLDDAVWCMRLAPSCQLGVTSRCRCKRCTLTRIDAKLAELRKGET